MIGALLRVRFRALFAAFTNQARQKQKKSSKGMVILFAFLYLYLAAVLCGATGFLFYSLAKPYHALGLDWLYFAMAGLMAFGFAVIGSVFTTQNQLYDAKDNDLLLSMPIKPGAILLSRMIPLLALNTLYAGIIMLPAIVVYAIFVKLSLVHILLPLLCLVCVVFLAQAVSCVFGWLLHLLLSKIHKSVGSVLFMVLFFVVYFAVYSQAEQILAGLAANGQQIATSLQSWVWPLYAMGLACTGRILHFLGFAAICAAAFLLVYRLLSVTFLHTATARKSGSKRALKLDTVRTGSVYDAIFRKELRLFLTSPVYLTNMGIGILFVLALSIAGVIFRGTLLAQLGPVLPMLQPYLGLILCAALASMISMICISTPSVSLEGKNLWILKSLPLSPRQILLGKLRFHILLSAPVCMVSGLILSVCYGCTVGDTVFVVLIPGILCVLSGVLGLVCGLKWARFDWISEAYPVKQSISVAVVMFSMMGLPLVFGLLFMLIPTVHPTLFLAAVAAILGTLCFLFYRLLMTWGIRKWNAL